LTKVISGISAAVQTFDGYVAQVERESRIRCATIRKQREQDAVRKQLADQRRWDPPSEHLRLCMTDDD